MSRSEDSFEEYNLDNESLDSKSFEEKGDIEPMKVSDLTKKEPMKVSDLTKKLSEWNIYKAPLKDHSTIRNKRMKSPESDNIRSLMSRSGSVNSQRSVSFREPPSETFREPPSETFREPPSEIGFEDYIAEATRRALTSVKNQSLPRRSSIGALSDLTDEEDYGRESTLSDIRLSEYTLERILRSCENNFDFLHNISSHIDEYDFDAYISQLLIKKGGASRLPRHNEPARPLSLEDMDMDTDISNSDILSFSLNRNTDASRSILSPPNIKTPSPPGFDIHRPIALRVPPPSPPPSVPEDSIPSYIKDIPRRYNIDTGDNAVKTIEVPPINPETGIPRWDEWNNIPEPGTRPLTDDARERADNIANKISTSILKNIEDNLKNEEEKDKDIENESKRLVDANIMVHLHPDLTIKVSDIPDDISPTNYGNLRQIIFLMYSNHLIDSGTTKELAVKIASKYLVMSPDDFITKDKINEIQTALFARIYESVIGIGKVNQLYSFLEMYNIYIAYLKTYHFIKDKIIESTEKEEHIQKISNLNSEMEEKIKSINSHGNTQVSYEKIKHDIRELEKEVTNLQEYLANIDPEKKEKMKADYEDAEEALGTITIRISIFMKSISNPIGSNINPKMAELFLLNPISRILSSILIATKELSKIPPRSRDNFGTQKLFGIEVELLGLVMPPSIDHYYFQNHTAALLWLMNQLIISLYYTRTWMIVMMGYTTQAIGTYLMPYLLEILHILKQWKKVTQESLENWTQLIEYKENSSSIVNETIIEGWTNQIIGDFGDYVDEITHVRTTMIVTAAANIQNIGKFAPPKSKELLNTIIRSR
tara:strand:+ start:9924 stop:12395 length:2472 start_codon:yes stop_codon:yes gene_type:complete